MQDFQSVKIEADQVSVKVCAPTKLRAENDL